MGEIAFRQAILHALVAAGIVEATLRAWKVRRPESRLRFWLIALAFPFLVLPLFLVAAPFRSGDRFAGGWALFSADRWHAVLLAGMGIDTIAFGLLALAGTLLFLRDVVPFLVATVRERGETDPPHRSPAGALLAMVGNLSQRTGCAAPGVVVLRTDASVLFVRGVRRHAVVLSDGVLARLSPEQLQAAIAHELGHLRFQDPLAGWALMGARLIMFWNPAVQLMARAIVQEMELRADRVAAEVTSAASFAAALRTLARRDSTPAVSRTRTEVLAGRLHHAHIAERLEAVMVRPAGMRFGRTRLAVVGAALGVLLFFVV